MNLWLDRILLWLVDSDLRQDEKQRLTHAKAPEEVRGCWRHVLRM